MVFSSVWGLGLAGCGQGVWPDRQPVVAENVVIDSLRFVPAGWRFVFVDSTTTIRFQGVHLGYQCSEILEMGLDSVAGAPDFTFRPKSLIRLPAQPDCPLDTSGRNILVTHVFKLGGGTVVLRNSSGAVTDEANLVRGKVSFDSINKELGIAHSVDQGHLFYRDTLLNPDEVGAPLRQLSADTLSSCQFLNQATVSKRGDTVMVRLSLVTLDSATVPDACQGVHADSIPVTLIP